MMELGRSVEARYETSRHETPLRDGLANSVHASELLDIDNEVFFIFCKLHGIIAQ